MTLKYILDENGNPVPCENVGEWGRWFEENEEKRRVAWDEIVAGPHTVVVSSVFLGLDHSYRLEGPPILYETMAFLKEEDPDAKRELGPALGQHRFATHDECIAFHREVVQRIIDRFRNENQIRVTSHRLLTDGFEDLH